MEQQYNSHEFYPTQSDGIYYPLEAKLNCKLPVDQGIIFQVYTPGKSFAKYIAKCGKVVDIHHTPPKVYDAGTLYL